MGPALRELGTRVLPDFPSDVSSDTSSCQRPVVIVLHGVLRSRTSTSRLSRAIAQNSNWEVHSLSYPSTRQPLLELARGIAKQVQDIAGTGQPVWAVTHSMGAIVLRFIMGLPETGGVRWHGCIMIAPPNQGSRSARKFSKIFGFKLGFRIIWGQATLQLAEETSKRQTPWPDPPMPCGIIAGTRSLAWGSPVSWLTAPFCMLPGTSDGTVQLGETVMTAPNDLVTHDASHSYLPQDPEVAALVIHFLQHGRFPPHAQRPSA
ncbi:hypothetical protein WJX84_003863 [Apatococcus fuscideae]|uniref:AB hydrolase-1 domain-containing protein n=1 Tax=Apatococcus fuscideae TaxID=2026836 RepID=A0AAW1SD00_9CHLO